MKESQPLVKLSAFKSKLGFVLSLAAAVSLWIFVFIVLGKLPYSLMFGFIGGLMVFGLIYSIIGVVKSSGNKVAKWVGLAGIAVSMLAAVNLLLVFCLDAMRQEQLSMVSLEKVPVTPPEIQPVADSGIRMEILKEGKVMLRDLREGQDTVPVVIAMDDEAMPQKVGSWVRSKKLDGKHKVIPICADSEVSYTDAYKVMEALNDLDIRFSLRTRLK